MNYTMGKSPSGPVIGEGDQNRSRLGSISSKLADDAPIQSAHSAKSSSQDIVGTIRPLPASRLLPR